MSNHTNPEQLSSDAQAPFSATAGDTEDHKAMVEIQHAPETKQEASPPKQSPLKHFVTLTVILTSTFLFALDNTIVANIQPVIVNEFDSISKLSWVGTGFALGAVSMLPWGKAYGMFDIKWVFVTCVVLFEAGSALTGAAPTMNALIVGRVLAGFGGGGLYTGALVYLAVLSTPERRPFYMSLTAILWGIGTVLGPVVGGGFAVSKVSWRWAFYINLLIAAVLAPGYLLVLPSVSMIPDTSFMSKCKRLDWLSLVFIFGGTACFTMAISFGGTVYPWNSVSEIVLIVFSAVTLMANVLITKYHPGIPKAARMYPAQFVKNHLLVNLQIQTLLASAVLLGTTYYIPLFFQLTRGDSPISSVVRLIPFIVVAVFFAPLNGFVVSKIGYYKPTYILGTLLMSLGTGLMLYIDRDTSLSKIYGFTVLTAVGVGSCSQAGYAAAQALVPPSEIPDLMGFLSVAQDFGGVIALGIGGTTYNNVASPRIMTLLLEQLPLEVAQEDLSQLLAGTSNGVLNGLDASLQTAVIEAEVYAMKGPWGAFFAAAAICFILSFFLSHQKVNIAYGSEDTEGLTSEKVETAQQT